MRGLLAMGRAGDWQVDLDDTDAESNSSGSRYGLTIANRTFYVQLEISDPGILSDLVKFFESNQTRGNELCFGSWNFGKVFFVKSEGRQQLRILSDRGGKEKNSALVELNLMPQETGEFIGALRDLLKDLGTEHI